VGVINVVCIVHKRIEIMLDGKGLHYESHNVVFVRFRIRWMVHDFNIDVVVHIDMAIFANKANRKALPVSRSHFFIVLNFTGGTEVVDDPVIMVVFANGLDELVGLYAGLFAPSKVGHTELFTEHVVLHLESVRRGLNAISRKELS
jgi:hypothetical protein